MIFLKENIKIRKRIKKYNDSQEKKSKELSK
jgi:hypothetical protein